MNFLFAFLWHFWKWGNKWHSFSYIHGVTWLSRDYFLNKITILLKIVSYLIQIYIMHSLYGRKPELPNGLVCASDMSCRMVPLDLRLNLSQNWSHWLLKFHINYIIMKKYLLIQFRLLQRQFLSGPDVLTFHAFITGLYHCQIWKRNPNLQILPFQSIAYVT